MPKFKNSLAPLVVFCGLVSSNAFSADWYVSYRNDEMRGTAQKFLGNVSDNSVTFDFPYNGGSRATIVLRSKKTALKNGQKAEDLNPTEALLTINKGQFLCHSFDDCYISVKFDNEPIQRYSMSESADSSADVIFFDNSLKFIKNLKSHKKVIIEASFFQEGKKQFKFDLTGYSTPKIDE